MFLNNVGQVCGCRTLLCFLCCLRTGTSHSSKQTNLIHGGTAEPRRHPFELSFPCFKISNNGSSTFCMTAQPRPSGVPTSTQECHFANARPVMCRYWSWYTKLLAHLEGQPVLVLYYKDFAACGTLDGGTDTHPCEWHRHKTFERAVDFLQRTGGQKHSTNATFQHAKQFEKPTVLAPTFQKQDHSRSLRGKIANFDELVAAASGTELSKYFEMPSL